MIKNTCKVCKKQYWLKNYRKNISKFCSNKCYGLSMTGTDYVPWNKGKKSPETLDTKNPNWKGDKIGYCGLHLWVKTNLGRPMECSECGTTKAKSFHWANISGEYKRSNGLKDWKRLCVKCHSAFDHKMRPEGKSKLTEKEVLEAKQFNVSAVTIDHIIYGKTWKHI